MAGLSDSNGGLFEILDDFADLKIEMEWIGAIARAFRSKISIALGVGDATARKKLLNWMSEVNREVGSNLITAQSALRRQGCLQSLDSQYHPFVGHPIFERELANLPLEERMKEMRKPNMKKRILEVPNSLWGKPFAAVSTLNPLNISSNHSNIQYRSFGIPQIYISCLQNVVWSMSDGKASPFNLSVKKEGSRHSPLYTIILQMATFCGHR